MEHLVSLNDRSAKEITALLDLAARLKRRKGRGRELAGKILALVFQKPSMRTRVSFEAAMDRLGGSCIYLGPDEVGLGSREPARDVARVLSRYVDGIVARTFGHGDVEEMARYATVPVINGLSDRAHPCQALSDLLTIRERCGRLRGLRLGYVGDGNNVLHSLMEGCARCGISVTAAVPRGYEPEAAVVAAARRAAQHGATIIITDQPEAAAQESDVLYTDVWTSMGQEEEAVRRRHAFGAFQLNARLLALAKPTCIVMHCLPAHRGEEITDDVMEGPRSAVFEQAENRLYTAEAVLVTLMRQRAKKRKG